MRRGGGSFGFTGHSWEFLFRGEGEPMFQKEEIVEAFEGRLHAGRKVPNTLSLPDHVARDIF